MNIRLARNGNKAAPTNPRKVSSGTSYDARGLIPPSAPLDEELGSAAPVVIPEIVPDLISPYQRTRVYKRMMTDAGVDVSMRVVKTPVMGAEFFVEPFSPDPNDVMISQFIYDNLVGGMSAPLINSMEDILHMFEDGYAVLEEVYEMRDWAPHIPRANSKTYTMLKKLGVRPAATIKEITYDDNGGPNAIVQNAILGDGTTKEVTL